MRVGWKHSCYAYQCRVCRLEGSIDVEEVCLPCDILEAMGGMTNCLHCNHNLVTIFLNHIKLTTFRIVIAEQEDNTASCFMSSFATTLVLCMFSMHSHEMRRKQWVITSLGWKPCFCLHQKRLSFQVMHVSLVLVLKYDSASDGTEGAVMVSIWGYVHTKDTLMSKSVS